MKKQLLTFILFFASSLLVAQSFNQPSIYNNVCDDNNDGIAAFWLGEISFEILGNLNTQDYSISHHETQFDAATGTNALSSPYTNILPYQQTLFARIVTNATGDVSIIGYPLNVNPAPSNPTVSITNCANTTTSFPCWDLTSVQAQIAQGATASIVTFFTSQADAFSNVAQIANPSCYVSPSASPVNPPVYYRVENAVTGCFAVGVVELITIDCGGGNTCNPPISFQASSNDLTSLVLSWTNDGSTTQSSIVVLPAGSPPPTNNTTAFYAATSPYVITGLSCGTTYDVYIRTFCNSANLSSWVSQTVATLGCPIEAGQPTDLRQCAGSNGQACFNLNQNDVFIINTLNPAEYTVTYHNSQADAANDVSPLASPYCTATSQAVFARLENNATQEFQIFGFSVMVETFTQVATPLNSIQQCDDNNDGFVTFDLTTVQAQINSTNPLQYYPSLANAQNQVVPFTNPSVLNISVQNQITNVFVREIVADGCDNIYSFQIQAFANCNVAYTCSQANSLCNSLGAVFQNTTNMSSTGTYGCLNTSPNQTWFYLPVSQAGTINLLIQQSTSPTISSANLDADYVVFGPFSDPVTPCNGQLTPNFIVSCSYSASATENVVINNAVPGQYYLLMVTNFSNQSGYIKISEVTGSTGAIDCSGLRLNAFLDVNNNGTQDNGEQNFPLGQFTYEINNSGNVHNVVSPTGYYNIYDTNGNNSYDISYAIDPNYTASYGITTASYSNIQVVIGGGLQTYNFPITITQPYNDLAVHIIPVNAPRPGFTYMNKIVYTNNGNQTITSGTVTFNHDPLVAIVTNTQTGTSPITNGFTYNFSNLLPFESREMIVTLQVPTIPTVALGGLLTNTASIVPLTGDVVPENNSAVNTQIIIGAYDPNDKMEAHGERILYTAFSTNDYLTYTIRFENTGTANAENVRVNDILDAGLDANTIRMVSASHSYVMDRVGNQVNWIFEDIQLPPSVANTNIGKGYITFQIKPLSGFAVGDIIPNTASIYFDFNPPIITNTFNTEFVQQLGVDEFENNDFVFYPNPVSDWLTISVRGNANIAGVTVYDILGKMVFTQQVSNLSTQTIDLSAVSKGMYLVEVTTDTNHKVIKKLIVD
ncbi:hypothetical protein GCM10022386_14860 [Flavobacterium cheonhonense]|uniref:Fibronectin type-III domain-containing protein n=2 Tax=Flavobacterium TaxID=237 RepID=A0ABP7TVE6_9FLAO|nr:T9SS type A sorting domain-containing protein [Flavobacterium cheonhonense]